MAASLAKQKSVRGDGRILVDLVMDPCENSNGRRHSESTCRQCDDLFNLLNRNACRQGFPYAGMHRALTHGRSEEHTSELQSQSNLVCRLLLEKKKKKQK